MQIGQQCDDESQHGSESQPNLKDNDVQGTRIDKLLLLSLSCQPADRSFQPSYLPALHGLRNPTQKGSARQGTYSQGQVKKWSTVMEDALKK